MKTCDAVSSKGYVCVAPRGHSWHHACGEVVWYGRRKTDRVELYLRLGLMWENEKEELSKLVSFIAGEQGDG